MKSMMKRNTFREIKKSFGRYFAILAIIALGVALFSGLKITQSVMVHSADVYLKDLQFYDYRLVSTLGFTEENVEALADKKMSGRRRVPYRQRFFIRMPEKMSALSRCIPSQRRSIN